MYLQQGPGGLRMVAFKVDGWFWNRDIAGCAYKVGQNTVGQEDLAALRLLVRVSIH